MAWTRYDLWDPWLVKKTNQVPRRWAVVDMHKHAPVYITYFENDAHRYLNTLQGEYKVAPYNGFKPNGIQ